MSKEPIKLFDNGGASPFKARLKKWIVFISIIFLAVVVFIGFNIAVSIKESNDEKQIAQKVISELKADKEFISQVGGDFELKLEPYVSVFRSDNRISSATCKIMIYVDGKSFWVTCNLDKELNIVETVVTPSDRQEQ